MLFRDTPGPGGFGPAPAFQHAHQGIKLQPAQTHPDPGVYNGPFAAAGHPWLLVVAVIAVLAAVAVTATVVIRLRR